MAPLNRRLVGLGLVAVAAGMLLGIATAPVSRGQASDAATRTWEPTRAADPHRGPAVYRRECAFCHGPEGAGTHRGPPLTGVGAASADFYLRSGRMPLDSPGAEARRREPVLTDAQIRELVSYIASLGGGPPIPDVDLDEVDLARGGELYRRHCASCHNWNGKGGALLNRENAPELHGVPPTQIAEAVRIGPGTMPEFGENALSKEDLDDLVVYAAGLESPRDRGGYHWGHWGPATETVAGFLGLGVLLVVTGLLGERR